ILPAFFVPRRGVTDSVSDFTRVTETRCASSYALLFWYKPMKSHLSLTLWCGMTVTVLATSSMTFHADAAETGRPAATNATAPIKQVKLEGGGQEGLENTSR